MKRSFDRGSFDLFRRKSKDRQDSDFVRVRGLTETVRNNSVVILDVNFDHEEAVAVTMLDALMATEAISDHDKEILVGHSGITHPHKENGHLLYYARIAGLRDRCMVFARARYAVNLDAPDCSLIQYAVMVIDSTTVSRKLSKLTNQSIKHLIDDKDYRYDIHEARTPAQFKEAVLKHAPELFRSHVELKYKRKLEREDGLVRTGQFGGGVKKDIERRLPNYKSDFTDGFVLKSLSAALFMFFACLAPGVAFGAVTQDRTDGQMGVIEFLLCQTIVGCVFALFAGQPLVILRPTGPITVFLLALYKVADGADIEFLPFVAWVGLWGGFFLIMMALFDTCYMIKYMSEFTEEIFGFFVCVIFLYEGFHNTIHYFVDDHWARDQALWSFMVMAMAFVFTMQLNQLRRTAYFTARVREVLSDFAVPVAIIAVALINRGVPEIEIETLDVPDKFETTLPGRDWLIDLSDVPTWLPFAASVPALLLAFLIYIDQNVSTLLTEKDEHNLKKGSGFHLNLLVVGVFNMVLPLFGMPYVMGSLPHSPQFAHALAVKEEFEIDGRLEERIIHVHENRVAPLVANLLVGVSLVALPLLQELPRSAFDGLFFFMACTGLMSNTLWERTKLLFMETRQHPPSHYSRHVRVSRVHAYTLTQLAAVGVLFAVAITIIGLAFPLFVVGLIPLRIHLQSIFGGHFFAARDLDILDSKPPEPVRNSRHPLRPMKGANGTGSAASPSSEFELLNRTPSASPPFDSGNNSSDEGGDGPTLSPSMRKGVSGSSTPSSSSFDHLTTVDETEKKLRPVVEHGVVPDSVSVSFVLASDPQPADIIAQAMKPSVPADTVAPTDVKTNFAEMPASCVAEKTAGEPAGEEITGIGSQRLGSGESNDDTGGSVDVDGESDGMVEVTSLTAV